MKLKNKNQSGFTLMELLIAIAIVAILAAVAVPTYLSYTERAKFSEIVQAADQLKTATAACIDSLGTATGCTSGQNGIPTITAYGNVGAAAVADGVVTVTGQGDFASTDGYQLQPTVGASGITWVVACNGDATSLASNCTGTYAGGS